MEKKVAAVWLTGILCATLIGFGILWFAPQQDSVIKASGHGKIRLGNVTIPLEDILDRANPNRPSPIQPPENNLKLILIEAKDEVEQSVKDLEIGELLLEVDIELEGRNVEKLVRGIAPIYSPSSTSWPYRIDREDINLIAGYLVAILVIGIGGELVVISVKRHLNPKEEP